MNKLDRLRWCLKNFSYYGLSSWALSHELALIAYVVEHYYAIWGERQSSIEAAMQIRRFIQINRRHTLWSRDLLFSMLDIVKYLPVTAHQWRDTDSRYLAILKVAKFINDRDDQLEKLEELRVYCEDIHDWLARVECNH